MANYGLHCEKYQRISYVHHWENTPTLPLCSNCLILKLEGLSGAHEVHARFKGKNSCFKAMVNIFCTSAVSTFTYVLRHYRKLYMTQEMLQFLFVCFLSCFLFFTNWKSKNKTIRNKLRWAWVFPTEFSSLEKYIAVKIIV